MHILRIKYYFLFSLTCFYITLNAQEQSIVTIIGDDLIEVNNTHDFINTNPYSQSKEPPMHQEIAKNQDVYPSLENGFHMRFEVSYERPAERLGGGSFASSYGEFEKVKKRSFKLTERKFNIKKRFKKWLPIRPKKYHPTNCGRF